LLRIARLLDIGTEVRAPCRHCACDLILVAPLISQELQLHCKVMPMP